MSNLFDCYRWAPMFETLPHSSENHAEYVPSWIKMQLRNHTAKGIMRLEVAILNELDGLLYGSRSIGCQNPLAVGVCLWKLILAYRGHLSYVSARFLLVEDIGKINNFLCAG